MVTRFEDLQVWQLAIQLAKELHFHTQKRRIYYVQNQIMPAALSVSNNIAEGFCRGTHPQFRYFLKVAIASCGEVQSMIGYGVTIGYFSPTEAEHFTKQTMTLIKKIAALISTLGRRR